MSTISNLLYKASLIAFINKANNIMHLYKDKVKRSHIIYW